MPATDPLAELAKAVRRAPVDAQGAEDALKALAMASAMLGEAAAERMAGGPDSCAAALVGLLANPASPAILAEMAAMILTTLLNNSEPRCREVAAQGALPVLVAAMGRRDGDVAFAAAGAAFFLVDGCADLAGAMLEAGFAEAAAVAMLADPALGSAAQPRKDSHKCAVLLLQVLAAASGEQRAAVAAAGAVPLLQAEAAQSRCPYTQASAAHILSTLR